MFPVGTFPLTISLLCLLLSVEISGFKEFERWLMFSVILNMKTRCVDSLPSHQHTKQETAIGDISVASIEDNKTPLKKLEIRLGYSF